MNEHCPLSVMEPEWAGGADKQIYYDDIILPAKLNLVIEDTRIISTGLNGVHHLPKQEQDVSRCCQSCPVNGNSSEEECEADNKTWYECPHCDSRFNLSIALKYHIKGQHERAVAPDALYRCSYCDFVSELLVEVRRHVKESHLPEKRHHCPYCKYRARRSTHLRRHIEARHGLDKPQPQEKGEECADDEKPLMCSECNFATSVPRSLKRHIKNCHDNRLIHKCPHCDFAASQTREIRHHVKVEHENAKAYDCPCCPYRTVHLGSLKNHIMAKHTNEKGHKCPHCPYKAVQSGNLKRHLLTKHPNNKKAAKPGQT